MKKPAKTVDECIERLQAVTDALVSERASPDMIVEALVILAVKTGQGSRRSQAIFDAAEKVFANAAYDAFEKGKKERAEKRARRLGLTDGD